MPLVLLQEAGTLSLEYDGPPLSLLATAVVQLELDRAIRHVSIDALTQSGLMFRQSRLRYPLGPGGYGYFPFAPEFAPGAVFQELLPIRAAVTGVRRGSIVTEIGLLVTTALADPDVRAIAIGVLSNVVTSLGAASVRWARAKLRSGSDERSLEGLRPTSDLGPYLRGITAAVAPYVQRGQRARILFRHTEGDIETVLEIEIDDAAA